MISSVLSHDEELEVNSAYAKIALIADTVWAQDREDPYVKLNRRLWIENCKSGVTNEGGSNEEKSRSVRDVIPMSRLAQYGDYLYDEEREKKYKANDETRGTWPDQRGQSRPDDRAPPNEPWMLRQVEEYFIMLTSPIHRFPSSPTRPRISHQEKIGTETSEFEGENDFGKYSRPLLYTVIDRAERQLQARVCSKLVKDLWNSRAGQSCRWEKKRGLNDGQLLNEEKLSRARRRDDKRAEIKKHCEQSYAQRADRIARRESLEASCGEARRSVFPALSAEVPEFFPKGPPSGEKERQVPMQFFPSSSERSYQDELFPYNRAHTSVPQVTDSPFREFAPLTGTIYHARTTLQNPSCVPIAVSHPPTLNTFVRAPHQWIHRIVPPIQIQVPAVCSAVHPPIYSAIQPICPTIIHRPIAIHEKIIAPGQTNSVPIPVYQRPAELYQEASQRRSKNHHGVDFNNLILLTKSAMKARRNQPRNPQRASSFILESRQPNLKSERDVLRWLDKGYPKRAREFATVNSLVSELGTFAGKCDWPASNRLASSSEVCDNPRLPDNPVEASVDDADLPVAKKRLYRDVLTNSASSDLIVDNVLDGRYDELEKQAMEQYRTSEECLALRYQELERQALEQYKNSESSLSSSEGVEARSSSTTCARNDRDDDGRGPEGEEDGTRCSGFGNRGCPSPGKDGSTERGAATERQITILRSDNKCPSVPSTAFRGSAGQTANARGKTLVTKSLTALTRETFVGNSKNTIKGASGDKVEERGEPSLNNGHLILVSPLKQSIPPRADIINEKAISSYYRKPTTVDGGIASGGGDEKVTILRSPSAQVWLSSFWG